MTETPDPSAAGEARGPGPPLRGPRHPLAWVSTTYFAEGFPYAVVHIVAETLFAELGASLKAIGLTSLLHLPWNLKFTWAPFLDTYGTKRTWLLGAQACLVGGLVLLGLATAPAAPNLVLLSVLFAGMAVVAATHDVAIDGYYLEALGPKDQSKWAGLRVGTYRVALVLARGPVLGLAAVLGFAVAFQASAAVFGLLLAFHVLFLPRVERAALPLAGLLGVRTMMGVLGLVGLAVALVYLSTPERAEAVEEGLRTWLPGLVALAESIGLELGIGLFLLLLVLAGSIAYPRLERAAAGRRSGHAAAFASFLGKPRVHVILAFVMTFRVGEAFLEKMRYPFLKSQGMDLRDYAWVSTAGLLIALGIPSFGAWVIGQQGLRRWILPFMLAQNVLNLLYVGLASVESPSLAVMSGVLVVEMVGASFGLAVLTVYLVRCPLSGHKAAHFALLTALMSVGFLVAGSLSGALAERLGFRTFFFLSFLASLPAMLLVPFLPHLDERPSAADGE